MKTARNIEAVDVDAVHVGERLRAAPSDKVSALAASMKDLGLLTPISVRYFDEYEIDGEVVSGVPVLVAGATRLAAAKKLGWEKIDCIFLTGDDIDAQLWEIDENLARAELSPSQIAEHMAKRKALWQSRRNNGNTVSENRGRGRPQGFAAETAAATGRTKQSINEAVARGEKIAPDVLKAVQGTDLDKGTTLDKLAKMPVTEQRRAIATGIEKNAGVDASEQRLKAAQNAYNRLNDEERRVFLEWLEENEPAIFDTTPAGRAA